MAIPNIFLPKVTDAGKASAISLADIGLRVQLDEVSFGTGQYNPTGIETALLNEVKRVPITGASRPRPNHLRAVGVWPDLDEESEIGEVGFWHQGVLFAVWSRAIGGPVAFKTFGVEFVAFFEMVFEDIPADSVEIVINPLVSEALAAVVTHEVNPSAHPQYLLRSAFVDAHALMTATAVGGTPDAITLTLPPESVVIDYEFGQQVVFVATADNTGPVTVNVSGRGVRAVTAGGAPLSAGDLTAGSVYTLFFDGANFQVSGGIGGGATLLRHEHTATAGQTSFPASYVPGGLIVTHNGRVLSTADYVATDGTSVVLVTPALLGDAVVVLAFRPFRLTDHWTKSESDERYLLASASSGLSPPGMIAHFARDSAPAGWLKANGALVSRTTYAALYAALGDRFGAGDGATTFRLPDLRGEFLRGWDDGRGIDTGRLFGSGQADELRAHTHTYDKINLIPDGERDNNQQAGNTYSSATTGSTGGGETRPRNVAMLACVRY